MNILPASAARALAPWASASAVQIGVRPEHMHWGPAPEETGLAAQVVRTEHLGDVALVHCKVDGAPEPLLVKTALAPRELPAVGQPLRLHAAPDRVHCFDAQHRALPAAALH
jgi:ABC-type sugar transport system ATPase subunit